MLIIQSHSELVLPLPWKSRLINVVVIVGALPINPDPISTEIIPLTLDDHPDWCHRLLTPAFDGAEKMVLTVSPMDAAVVADVPPNGPGPTPANKTVPTLVQQPSLFPHDDIIIAHAVFNVLAPSLQSLYSHSTATPTGIIFLLPPFSRVLDMIALLDFTHNVVTIADALLIDPDPAPAKKKTPPSSLVGNPVQCCHFITPVVESAGGDGTVH
ncbi:hypothetical protein EV421DRAFT_1908173 [Armillaria borealis]|uniref:Uncharacterized protein n=1 Tax=Armillaria borealis TaxID=47425 RepID=A0AA39MJF9_9AGAR|nr:hypothetical protein EV421DRAFT_1908173 [Armillaria borealis]